jgi:hypothetical protein
MQHIYNYIPKKTLFMVHSVAAVLYLQSVLHIMFFAREIYSVLLHQHFPHFCAVHNMAAFFNTLILCFPGMLLRYCLTDFEMVRVFLLLPVSRLLSNSTCTEFQL